MAQPEHMHERVFLTKEEKERGLQVLAELEALDRDLGDALLPDSIDLIHQMRDEHTHELIYKLEE